MKYNNYSFGDPSSSSKSYQTKGRSGTFTTETGKISTAETRKDWRERREAGKKKAEKQRSERLETGRRFNFTAGDLASWLDLSKWTEKTNQRDILKEARSYIKDATQFIGETRAEAEKRTNAQLRQELEKAYKIQKTKNK